MAGPARRTDLEAAQRAVSELIRALGLDPATEPELRETPSRVARFYQEFLTPSASEPELAVFPAAESGLVVARDLPFYSLCVHHLAPFFGRATVAYLPGSTLVGISGAARVLAHHAGRPQLQERLTTQIADHLERVLKPRGIAVVLEARHLCMEMRGVHARGLIETRVVRGALAEPQWAEALAFHSAGAEP